MLKFPNETRGYLKLAIYFYNKNDNEKMMQCLKAGESKGNLTCIANIGSALVVEEKYDEAIIYFTPFLI